jgi:large subunit ribosomal protein L21
VAYYFVKLGGFKMYAVISSGGKQYKVKAGDVLRIEKISGEIDETVSFDKILMFSDGDNVQIGQPDLDGVSVNGRIMEQGKAKKIIVFKYKKRKRYRRKKGHRQEFTAVLIDGIKSKAQKSSETKDEAEAKKPEADEAAPKKEEAKEAAPDTDASKKAETKTTTTNKDESQKETE